MELYFCKFYVNELRSTTYIDVLSHRNSGADLADTWKLPLAKLHHSLLPLDTHIQHLHTSYSPLATMAGQRRKKGRGKEVAHSKSMSLDDGDACGIQNIASGSSLRSTPISRNTTS
jgi:hypothetical protein